jgi:nitrate/nitrite transporter NarK
MHKGFLKSGHLPILFASFLYFDLSFMVWVLLGPLGVAIARELHLDAGQKGLMVATPGAGPGQPQRRPSPLAHLGRALRRSAGLGGAAP